MTFSFKIYKVNYNKYQNAMLINTIKSDKPKNNDNSGDRFSDNEPFEFDKSRPTR
ncbi:1885_t:CDS:2 [Acaulospora morrowiae]|uniref:1885_t:CDS:1 n=1 Tax=Acaulospora morrowiae TaxID=94023 RepID=A0A9N9A9E3_9GLOM|nr:1885_t:CDS:2 [Acaulospora morrowiae]